MHAATDRAADPPQPWRWWHLLLIVALSAGYEALFLTRSNGELFDEGWPLYAAMRLHAGGVLYRDVFFVFPPGHVLPAWLAYGLDPPGVELARAFYGAFNVALCVVLYFLGRRIMPVRYALFGALLVALAAPHSHMGQLLFGYRFLIFSALALLGFARWLDDRWRGWLLLAGVWTGVALLFRSTPAFAVSCGIGVGLLAAQTGSSRDNTSLITRDTWLGGGCFAGGLLLVLSPALIWFASGVGLDALWRENVVRVMGLQLLQSLAVPTLALPDFSDRKQLHYWFAALQYWSYGALYGSYAAGLGIAWWRARQLGRRYDHTLLLAITIWGGVFLLRTLGRSDDHHLNSALPPVCLLLGHLAFLGWRRFGEFAQARDSTTSGWAGRAELAALLAAFGVWLVVQGHDRHFDLFERGFVPIEAGSDSLVEGLKIEAEAAELERLLRIIAESSNPDDTILDLTASPLLHPLSGRQAVGEFDIFMPGTFLDEEEESRFVARLEAKAPALVIWPGWPFDNNPERGIQRTAPKVSRWVKERYQPRDSRRTSRRFIILVPRK